MSTFQINTYLVDEFGDYILTESGDKIIIATTSIDVDYSAAAAITPRRLRPVLTFQVKKDEDQNWYLITNRQTLVGRYPSREVTLGALYGIYIQNNGSPDGFASFLEDALSTRGAVIDPDENGLTLARSGRNYNVALDSRNDATISPNTGTLMVAVQYRADGVQFNATGSILDTDISVIDIDTPTSTAGSVATYTFGNAYLDQDENSYARAIIVNNVSGTYTVTNVIGTPVLVKDDVDNTNISFTVEIQDAITGDFANAVVTDSSTLDPDESISFTYAWSRQIPSLTGITGSEN